MPAKVLRIPAGLFAVGTLLLALTSCGSNSRIACNASSGSDNSTCICGSGTAACPVQPGPEFLYSAAITSTGGQIGSQILAFSVDHSSGALTSIGSVPGPSAGLGLTAVSNQFLYASDSHNAQIDGFSINQATGALASLAGSPFSTGIPSFPGVLAAPPGDLGSPPGNSLLYAADAGTIDMFAVTAAGAPTALSGSPTVLEAGFSLVVDPSGGFLYASDADPPGGVLAFTIGSTGALTQVPGSPFAISGQGDSLPTGIADNGSYVYTTLPLTNQIAAFSIVSGTGALSLVPGSPFAAGNSPISIIIANNFLYALNVDSISGYSINSSSGVLTPLSGSPLATVGLSMATDFLGQLLYVASPIGIQAFTINSSSGALTPILGSPFAGPGATLLTMVQIPPP
ncbi:MAG: hypothetical protein WAN65_27670 [Candidatus Sulfotelmatobacter sp.]